MSDDDLIRRGDGLVEQAIAELQEVVHCRCREAYKDLGLHDPDCQCDSQNAVHVVAARIAAMTATVERRGRIHKSLSKRFAEANSARKAAEAERDALRAKVARLEGALRHYRETLCEGFCGEDMWADEGHSHPEIQRDCGGCLAASVLLSAALTDGGKDE